MEQHAERRNLVQPPDWWAAFAGAAARKGVSLSEWIGDACRRALRPDERRALSDRRTRGQNRKRFPDATSDESEKSV